MTTLKLYNGTERRVVPNSIAVDPDKIRKEFRKRNVTASEVSRSIGYANNSLSAAIFAGVFAGPMVQGLASKYNIRPEDYEFKQPEPETIEPVLEDTTVNVDETAMYTIMKKAFVDAIGEFLNDNLRNVINMISAGVRDGFK